MIKIENKNENIFDSEPTVIMMIPSDATWPEAVKYFIRYLQASGYYIEGDTLDATLKEILEDE